MQLQLSYFKQLKNRSKDRDSRVDPDTDSDFIIQTKYKKLKVEEFDKGARDFVAAHPSLPLEGVVYDFVLDDDAVDGEPLKGDEEEKGKPGDENEGNFIHTIRFIPPPSFTTEKTPQSPAFIPIVHRFPAPFDSAATATTNIKTTSTTTTSSANTNRSSGSDFQHAVSTSYTSKHELPNHERMTTSSIISPSASHSSSPLSSGSSDPYIIPSPSSADISGSSVEDLDFELNVDIENLDVGQDILDPDFLMALSDDDFGDEFLNDYPDMSVHVNGPHHSDSNTDNIQIDSVSSSKFDDNDGNSIMSCSSELFDSSSVSSSPMSNSQSSTSQSSSIIENGLRRGRKSKARRSNSKSASGANYRHLMHRRGTGVKQLQSICGLKTFSSSNNSIYESYEFGGGERRSERLANRAAPKQSETNNANSNGSNT